MKKNLLLLLLSMFLLAPAIAESAKIVGHSQGEILLRGGITATYQVFKMSDGKYLYKFNNSAKFDDGAFYLFMLTAIKDNYGRETGEYMGAKLELYPVGEIKAISLNAIKYRYFAIHTKESEEDKRISSIVFWRENIK